MNTLEGSNTAFSVAIIAGGKSQRMGRDKAFVELGGKPMIEHVIARSAGLGQAETILITNNFDDYRHLGLEMYSDVHPGKGSLGGIYTALKRAQCPDVLVLACDMPLIKTELLRFMLGQVSEAYDIVVPRVAGYPQGMHAIYKKTCLAPIAEQLAKNRLKIIRFYQSVRVRYLDEIDYAAFDLDGQSFTNLNTPAELEQARHIILHEATGKRM